MPTVQQFIWDQPAEKVTAFDNAYLNSLDPRLLACMRLTDYQARKDTAFSLAKQGLLVDANIIVGGADPFIMMLDRQNIGLHSVPSGLQSPPAGPFNLGPYADPKIIPAGALLVSTNPDDFPPFTKLTPPLLFDPEQIGNPFGYEIGGKPVFSSRAQAHHPDGWITPDGKFTYKILENDAVSVNERVAVWLQN